MIDALKILVLLLVVTGVLRLGYSNLSDSVEASQFEFDAVPLPIAAASPSEELVWASVGAIAIGGFMVVGGFWLIVRRKILRIRAKEESERGLARF